MVMSEVFWSGITISIIGCILAMGIQCYKSKCKEVQCGCLKIVRDTEIEEREDIEEWVSLITSLDDETIYSERSELVNEISQTFDIF